MSADVCAADSAMRSRAVPSGTVGGRIAGTHSPASASDVDTLVGALRQCARAPRG